MPTKEPNRYRPFAGARPAAERAGDTKTESPRSEPPPLEKSPNWRLPGRDDSYLAGYATAVLDRQFGAASRTVTVRDGIATVSAADLAGKHDEAAKALSSIKGISRVEMIAARPGTPGEASARTRPETGRLPGGYLFNPLIADPRWPHFSLSYQRYINDRQLGNIGSVGLGESFTFYRDELGPGFWEVGIQAGVFALFDMDAVSKDLINADYFGAVFAAYRVDRFSTFARLFHQSSHLGDEFLLRNSVERILKTRTLVCVVSDAATARDPELAIHLRMALRQGWTEEQLTEVLLHLTAYVGLPVIRESLLTASKVFTEMRGAAAKGAWLRTRPSPLRNVLRMSSATPGSMWNSRTGWSRSS